MVSTLAHYFLSFAHTMLSPSRWKGASECLCGAWLPAGVKPRRLSAAIILIYGSNLWTVIQDLYSGEYSWIDVHET